MTRHFLLLLALCLAVLAGCSEGRPGDVRTVLPINAIAYNDSVLPVHESGQAHLVDGTHSIDESLLIEPAPGHTPGHILLKVLGERGGVFCGDVIHHPLQIYAPHWNTQFCRDPEQARATRRGVLQYCADSGSLLFPTHFGRPHVASVSERGGQFSAGFVQPR